MRKLFFLLVLSFFINSLRAQNDSLTIPALSLELKHEKAIRGHVFFNYISIVGNRSRGISAYETGEFYGNSLGLTWGPVMNKGLISYTEWLTAYITLFMDYNLQILHNSKYTLEFKIKNIGEQYISKWAEKYKPEDWLTNEEYFDFMSGFRVSTTIYVGFNAKSEIKNGWLYLKISVPDEEHNKKL